MFISKPHDGYIYFAQHVWRGKARLPGLRWCMIAIASDEPGMRVEARDVPEHIKYRAYKMFEGDRNRL